MFLMRMPPGLNVTDPVADASPPCTAVAGDSVVADDPAPVVAVTVFVAVTFFVNLGSLATPASDFEFRRFPSPYYTLEIRVLSTNVTFARGKSKEPERRLRQASKA